MKRLSSKQKKYFNRIKTLREMTVIKKKLEHLKAKLAINRNKKLKDNRDLIKQMAPEFFNIVSPLNRKALCKFTRKFRSFYYKKNICLELDFTETKKMGTEGTLYFLAELDNLIHINRNIKFIVRLSNDLVVNQVLEQTGILKLLKVKVNFEGKDFDESVKFWRFASGYNAEIDSANHMLDDFDHLLSKVSSQSVYKGITEALTNSHHHAYLDDRYRGAPKGARKWWLFSQEKEGVLNVCVCDLGIGISRSLTSNSDNVRADWFGILKSFLRSHRHKYNPDSASIKAAIEIGNSRTKLPNRGKGLNQIINDISHLSQDRASVAIFSNKGAYVINKKIIYEQKTESLVGDMSFAYKDSLEGTVITWHIPLDKHDPNVSLGD
jgi:hypothetical protein